MPLGGLCLSGSSPASWRSFGRQLKKTEDEETIIPWLLKHSHGCTLWLSKNALMFKLMLQPCPLTWGVSQVTSPSLNWTIWIEKLSFLFSDMLSEIKGVSPSASLMSYTTTHLKLQSRLALNFCTEETKMVALDSQVNRIAFPRIMKFFVCTCY